MNKILEDVFGILGGTPDLGLKKLGLATSRRTNPRTLRLWTSD